MPVNPDVQKLENLVMELQRRISDLERANPLRNATVSDGGITMTSGASFEIIDPTTGHVVVQMGALPSQYNRAGGIAQQGIRFNRADDGSLALVLADITPTTPPFKQALQITDRHGNVVMADDTNGGYGLANPNMVDTVFVDSNYVKWPQTNSTSFITVAYCWYQIQNPQIQWSIDYTGDVGTAGEVRLMATPDGGAGTRVQVDTTKVQGTSGSFGFWSYYNAWPFSIASRLNTYVYLELQARVTSGAGKMYTICSQFGGGQS